MHQAKDLTWKQERFVSEYLLSGNAAEAVRKAGYQTRCLSEIGYGYKRHPKVRGAIIEAQETRARRFRIHVELVAVKLCGVKSGYWGQEFLRKLFRRSISFAKI